MTNLFLSAFPEYWVVLLMNFKCSQLSSVCFYMCTLLQDQSGVISVCYDIYFLSWAMSYFYVHCICCSFSDDLNKTGCVQLLQEANYDFKLSILGTWCFYVTIKRTSQNKKEETLFQR